MVQVPAVTPVTVAPEIVQTPVVVELKLTVRPEVAVALTVPVPPTVTDGAVPKAMVWVAWAMVMFCVTWVAAL